MSRVFSFEVCLKLKNITEAYTDVSGPDFKLYHSSRKIQSIHIKGIYALPISVYIKRNYALPFCVYFQVNYALPFLYTFKSITPCYFSTQWT